MREKLLNVPLATAFLALVIMFAALWVKPVIGMADDGSADRILHTQGMYREDFFDENPYFDYFERTYRISNYYNEWESSDHSSQRLYLLVARVLNRFPGMNGEVFDIRWLSVILMLQLAGGIYFLMDYLVEGKGKAEKIVFGAAVILVFADTAYTAYFNSFYREGIAYASLLFLTALALLATKSRYPANYLNAGIIANGIILLFLDRRYLILAPLFFLLEPGRERRKWKALVLLGLTLLALVFTAELKPGEQEKYHAMTRGALTAAKAPEKTAEIFGMRGQLALLEGSEYREDDKKEVVKKDWFAEDFLDQYHSGTLILYYLMQPDELVALIRGGMARAYDIRPQNIGNYEENTGKQPGAKTKMFTIYSSMKSSFPKTIAFALIWAGGCLGLCLSEPKKLRVIWGLFLAAFFMILRGIVRGGSYGMKEGLFVYYLVFDLVGMVVLAPILIQAFVRGIRRGKKSFTAIKNKKRVAGLLGIIGGVLLLLFPVSAQAETQVKDQEKDKEKDQILIVTEKEKEADQLEDLVRSFGCEAISVQDTGLKPQMLQGISCLITSTPLSDTLTSPTPAVFLGESCLEQEGIRLNEYRDVSVEISFRGFKQTGIWEETMLAFGETEGEKIGEIRVGERLDTAFAVKSSNHYDNHYYIPWNDGQILGKVIIGEILGEVLEKSQSGQYFLILDEVYPYSDLDNLVSQGELLAQMQVPFIVSLMPISENMDTPAFDTYLQTLRGIKGIGGTLVFHDSVTADNDEFKDRLVKAGILVAEWDFLPVMLSWDAWETLTDGFEAGTFLTPMMFGEAVDEYSVQELEISVGLLLDHGITFADYGKIVREPFVSTAAKTTEALMPTSKEENFYTSFFDKGSSVLLFLVSGGVLIISILLLIGRKWYWKKYDRD